MHLCVYTHLYIPKYNLLSLYNVICMFLPLILNFRPLVFQKLTFCPAKEFMCNRSPSVLSRPYHAFDFGISWMSGYNPLACTIYFWIFLLLWFKNNFGTKKPFSNCKKFVKMEVNFLPFQTFTPRVWFNLPAPVSCLCLTHVALPTSPSSGQISNL